MEHVAADLELVTAHDVVIRTLPGGGPVGRARERGVERALSAFECALLESLRAPARPRDLAPALGPPGAVQAAATTLVEAGLVHRSGDVLDRPLVIISTPRAGSTLLFELLSAVLDVWTIAGESHFVIESFPELRPDTRGFESHRLEASDASPALAAQLRAAFVTHLRDADGARYLDTPPGARPPGVRFLEKTPRNALRVAFLAEAFPRAHFVFLHREAAPCIRSIAEAWRAPGFWQWRGDLPGWDREEWCMLLPPGWRSLVGRSIEEIAAFQWRVSNEVALDDLERLPAERWTALRFEDLVADPAGQVARLARFAGLELTAPLAAVAERARRPSSSVVSAPDREKWRGSVEALAPVLPAVEAVAARLAALR